MLVEHRFGLDKFQNVTLHNSNNKFHNFEILHVKEVKQLQTLYKMEGKTMLSCN